MWPKMKERLDILVVQRGLSESREWAQRLILSGSVWSGTNRLTKPGTKIDASIPLEVRSEVERFVSRGGEKLQHLIEGSSLLVNDLVCLDVGASTGGFTDCLLQNGARHVISVDVGYGQLDAKLRTSSKVTVLERTNARYLTAEALARVCPQAAQIALVAMDVSFISAQKVLQNLVVCCEAAKYWCILFKPQFEVGRKWVEKKGRVRSEEALRQALASFQCQMESLGLVLKWGPTVSPLAGKKSGNLEYLLFYEKLPEKHPLPIIPS